MIKCVYHCFPADTKYFILNNRMQELRFAFNSNFEIYITVMSELKPDRSKRFSQVFYFVSCFSKIHYTISTLSDNLICAFKSAFQHFVSWIGGWDPLCHRVDSKHNPLESLEQRVV